jgi:hypothetical protein
LVYFEHFYILYILNAWHIWYILYVHLVHFEHLERFAHFEHLIHYLHLVHFEHLVNFERIVHLVNFERIVHLVHFVYLVHYIFLSYHGKWLMSRSIVLLIALLGHSRVSNDVFNHISITTSEFYILLFCKVINTSSISWWSDGTGNKTTRRKTPTSHGYISYNQWNPEIFLTFRTTQFCVSKLYFIAVYIG